LSADTEAGSIYIHNPETRCLEFRHVLPESLTDRLPKDIPEDFGIAGEVFQCRKPIISTDQGHNEPTNIEEQTQVKVRSMLTVPLCVPDGDPVGVVQLINKRSGPFTEQDLEVFESVGAVSAMATANSLLVEHVGRTAGLMGMGNVSHDIANLAGSLRSHLFLVGPILDRLQIQHDSENLVTLREAFADVCAGTERLERYSHLIADIAAGRPVRISKKAGDISQTVADAVAYFEPIARRDGCRLIAETPASGKTSMFDPLAVNRIVENLITNAVKAVKERDCTREVRLLLRERGAEYVLEVADTGPGMPERAVQRILSGTAVSEWTASSGTGLGTKVIRELVSALGGRMEIESKIGTGTTFRVFIPSERMGDGT
jgi:signal transduction histidine kinase